MYVFLSLYTSDDTSRIFRNAFEAVPFSTSMYQPVMHNHPKVFSIAILETNLGQKSRIIALCSAILTNNLLFCIFLSNWKICVQVIIIFLSGAFKAEENSKIHMRYLFLRYSILAHPDMSCFLWYECTTDDFYCSIYPSFIHPGLM